MANEVKLPRLGQGMESGTVTRWLKSEGDQVEKGEPLFEIDTDKVTQEVESDFAGVLLRIGLAEGEAPVGPDDRLDRRAGRGGPGRSARTGAGARTGARPPRCRAPRYGRFPPRLRRAPPRTADASRPRRSPGGSHASAAIDLASLRGTGPEGRIVAEDVERGAVTHPRPPRPRR